MPPLPAGLWYVHIDKSYGAETWTNRYIVQAMTIQEAHTTAGQIYAAERSVTSNQITFTRYKTDDGVPNTDVFVVTTVNALGQRPAPGDLLPLWNVVRCDFRTLQGRPSRKYLRGVTEGETAAGNLDQVIQTAFQNGYVNVITGLNVLVDVDGQAWLDGVVHPKVGMRQLRRGSKRKLQSPSGP